jgi:hypothetical protein
MVCESVPAGNGPGPGRMDRMMHHLVIAALLDGRLTTAGAREPDADQTQASAEVFSAPTRGRRLLHILAKTLQRALVKKRQDASLAQVPPHLWDVVGLCQTPEGSTLQKRAARTQEEMVRPVHIATADEGARHRAASPGVWSDAEQDTTTASQQDPRWHLPLRIKRGRSWSEGPEANQTRSDGAHTQNTSSPGLRIA